MAAKIAGEEQKNKGGLMKRLQRRTGKSTCKKWKWKELNEEERQIWNSRAAEAMEAYKKELGAYSKSVALATSNDKKTAALKGLFHQIDANCSCR